jgi:hypothetical protein
VDKGGQLEDHERGKFDAPGPDGEPKQRELDSDYTYRSHR